MKQITSQIYDYLQNHFIGKFIDKNYIIELIEKYIEKEITEEELINKIYEVDNYSPSICYCSDALEVLNYFDSCLKFSIEKAKDFGYTIDDITSNLLADIVLYEKIPEIILNLLKLYKIVK